jgi:hypothetical protein
MEIPEKQILGQFRVRKRLLSGLVLLKGRASRFEAYSDQIIHLTPEEMRCIRGIPR